MRKPTIQVEAPNPTNGTSVVPFIASCLQKSLANKTGGKGGKAEGTANSNTRPRICSRNDRQAATIRLRQLRFRYRSRKRDARRKLAPAGLNDLGPARCGRHPRTPRTRLGDRQRPDPLARDRAIAAVRKDKPDDLTTCLRMKLRLQSKPHQERLAITAPSAPPTPQPSRTRYS